MSKNKKIITISQAIKQVEEKFLRISRMPELIGYRSVDLCKSYKNLIALCNSLSIVFLQYDLFKEAFIMLQKAVQIDSDLTKFGSIEDKLWQGRLITYNSLALLFHKLERNKDSLKLLFQAEHFLINLTDARITPHADIEISVNMLTFVTLWKVRKFKESCVYLERSAKIINNIISGKRPSQLSKISSKNLYGIVIMGLAALKCVIEKDPKTAVNMCREAIKQLEGNNVLSRPLILDLIKFITDHQNSSFKFPNISQVEFKPGSFQMFENKDSAEDLPNLRIQNIVDWLVTEKYEKVLFITTFVPLISPTTPWIDTIELERAQFKQKKGSVSEGYDNILNKKVRTILRKNNSRTESTPKPRIETFNESMYVPNRKFSQDTRVSDRSNTSSRDNRHIMFEFTSNDERNNQGHLDLVPLQTKGNLPVLRRTLINFKNSS